MTDDTKAETVAVQASRVTDEMLRSATQAYYLATNCKFSPYDVPLRAALEAALATPQPSEDEVKRVARVLYQCEMERGENCNALLSNATGKVIRGASVEPFEEHADTTWRPDAQRAIAALSPRPQAAALLAGEADATLNRLAVDAARRVARTCCVEDDPVAAKAIYREIVSVAQKHAGRASRPQAGMISADRACEIVGGISETHFGDAELRVAEAQNTIRMEASPRQDAEAEGGTLDQWAQEYLERASKAEMRLASLQSDYERAIEALKPFATVAEVDIGSDESDLDKFMPMSSHNAAALITVFDLRRARAIHSKAQAQKSGE